MHKVLLCILDGFGVSEEYYGNATLEATYIQNLIRTNNIAFLEASGRSVGLPDGQFGNSEVGHLTIGSGQVIKQKLPLISDAILCGEIDENKSLKNFIKNIRGSCHLMGLFSNGGVHSDLSHFFWAIKFLRANNINIKAHLFLDGRDVDQKDALKTLKYAIDSGQIRLSEIATISGRYYAMDRDNKLDRTKKAFDSIVKGIADSRAFDPILKIQEFYDQGIFDEMIPPFIVGEYEHAMQQDSFWMLNFRTDRIKQILKMIIDAKFDLLNMVDCGQDIDSKASTIFPSISVQNTLGEILSNKGISQLRIAETEKYAHVTYFFNGGAEIQYPGEDRILVPSPNVKDYATTPDMSSEKVTEHIIEALSKSSHQVIIANYATPDMIGHTGNFEATKQALQMLDKHIEDVVRVARDNDYIVVITSDHGNSESMIDQFDKPIKTHTNNKVPLILLPKIKTNIECKSLADISSLIQSLVFVGN